MTETVTLEKVYKELKTIENTMVTKEEMERILETMEIISNDHTMEQIKQSEEDIKNGDVEEIDSVN